MIARIVYLFLMLGVPLLAQASRTPESLNLAPARLVPVERVPTNLLGSNLSPKGNFLSTHFSGATWVWDAHTGACLYTWQDRSSPVGFTRGERWVVIWDPTGTWLEVWDWMLKKEVRRLGPFPTRLIASYTPDQPSYGFLAGEGNHDLWVKQNGWAGPVRGWNLSDGKLLGNLATGRIEGDPLLFHGNLLCLSPEDFNLEIWETKGGSRLRNISLLPPDLPESKHHLHAPEDMKILNFQIRDRVCQVEIQWECWKENRWIRSCWELVVPLPDGLPIWNAIPPVPKSNQTSSRPPDTRLHFIVDATIKPPSLFRQTGNDWRNKLPLEAEVWRSIAVLPLPEKNLLLQAGSDGCLRLWDLRKGTITATLALPPKLRSISRIDEVRSSTLHLVGGGKQVLVSWGYMDLFDLENHCFQARLGHTPNRGDGKEDGWVDEHSVFATGPGGLLLWDLQNLTTTRTWDRAFLTAISPDGRHLAFARPDPENPKKNHVLEVWDLITMKPLGETRHKGDIQAFRFTDDSRSLSIASEVRRPSVLGWPTWDGVRSSPDGVTQHISRWSLDEPPRQQGHQETDRPMSPRWTPQGFILGPPYNFQPSILPAREPETRPLTYASSDGRYLLKVSVESPKLLADTHTGRTWNLGPTSEKPVFFHFVEGQLVEGTLTRLQYWDLAGLDRE